MTDESPMGTLAESVRSQIHPMLEQLPFVEWDRFVKRGDVVDVYGWIARPDGHADFALLSFRFIAGAMGWSAVTSSEKHSEEIKRCLLPGVEYSHAPCHRVEHDFPQLTNVIRLEKDDASP